jgi:hypothetical protein
MGGKDVTAFSENSLMTTSGSMMLDPQIRRTASADRTAGEKLSVIFHWTVLRAENPSDQEFRGQKI